MSKFSYFIFLIFIMFFIQIQGASAKVNLEACKKMTEKLQDRHRSKANNIEEKYDIEINKILSNKNYANEDLREIIKTSEKYFEFKSAHTKYVDNILAILHNVPFNKADQEYCGKKETLQRISSVKISEFEKNRNLILEEIKHNLTLFNLREDEGLAVVAVYSYASFQSLDMAKKDSLTKPLRIKLLQNKQYFKVIKLREGEYYWNRLKQFTSSDGSYRYFDLSKSSYTFHVYKGKLSLAGVLILNPAYRGRLSSDFFDRVTISMKLLGLEYPFLLKKYPLIDGYNENDTFVNFYMNEKKNIDLKLKGDKSNVQGD